MRRRSWPGAQDNRLRVKPSVGAWVVERYDLARDDIRPVQIEIGAGLILPVGEVDRSAGRDRNAGA
jgi:hypothetical protein